MKKVKIPKWIQTIIFLIICFSLMIIPIIIFAIIYDFIKEKIIEEKKIKVLYCKNFHKKHHKLWSRWFDNTVTYECEKCGIKLDKNEKWYYLSVSPR